MQSEYFLLSQTMENMNEEDYEGHVCVWLELCSMFDCLASPSTCPNRDSRKHSGFSQTHKIAIIANCVFLYLQIPSLFTPCDVSKCEIGGQLVLENHIWRL